MDSPDKEDRNRMASISNQLMQLIEEEAIEAYYERYVNIETRVGLLLTNNDKLTYLKSQYDQLLIEFTAGDNSWMLRAKWQELSPIETICKEQVWKAYEQVKENITLAYILNNQKSPIDTKVKVVVLDRLLRDIKGEINNILTIRKSLNSSKKKDNSGLITNTFNRMPIEQVTKYFMQLSVVKSKNGRPFLQESEVKQFIKRAFLGDKSINKLKINVAPKGDQMFLWKLFYQFYLGCTDYNEGVESTVQCQEKYIKLLTDNFDNFTFNEVKANFSKSKQMKREWLSL